MNDLQTFVHRSRYARFLPEHGRRETWEETVERYIENVVSARISDSGVADELRRAIVNSGGR